MTALGFLLECAALAALLCVVASLVTASLSAASLRLARGLDARHRATLALLIGALPAVLAIASALAAALPSLLRLVGVGSDHCLVHPHHVHLCLEHFAGLRPPLALLGALSLAWLASRAALFSAQQLRGRSLLSALERLGRPLDDVTAVRVVVVPGRAHVLHAVGIVRRRVLVGLELLERLSERSRDAALAHERAHLERRDGLALLVLDLASLFLVPGLGPRVRRSFLDAAEEAADDAAAALVGDPTQVAQALVEVTRLGLHASQRQPLDAIAPALSPSCLEHRVLRLLSGEPPAEADPRGLAGALALAAGGVGLTIAFAPSIHHAAETLLARLS